MAENQGLGSQQYFFDFMLIGSSSPSSIVHMGWAALFIPANLRTLFLTLDRGISFFNGIVIFQFWKWLTKSISKSLPKWTGFLPELTWGTSRYVGAKAFGGVRAFLHWSPIPLNLLRKFSFTASGGGISPTMFLQQAMWACPNVSKWQDSCL